MTAAIFISLQSLATTNALFGYYRLLVPSKELKVKQIFFLITEICLIIYCCCFLQDTGAHTLYLANNDQEFEADSSCGNVCGEKWIVI
jgi:hypothetical protein